VKGGGKAPKIQRFTPSKDKKSKRKDNRRSVNREENMGWKPPQLGERRGKGQNSRLRGIGEEKASLFLRGGKNHGNITKSFEIERRKGSANRGNALAGED